MTPVLPKPRAGAHRRSRSWLRWSGRALLAAGFILLGYVALVLVQAKLYESDARQYVTGPAPSSQARPTPQPEPALMEGDILGYMEIPRLRVSAAVLQGTAIPGAPGNSVLAGHRDTFFRALKDIHDGDEIELKTAETSTRYLVDWAKVVAPEDISVLDSAGGSELTLVTCYPFYFIGAAPKRFVVRAHKVPTVEPLQERVAARRDSTTQAPQP